MWRKFSLVVALGILICTVAHADSIPLRPLTSSKKPVCEKAAPCRIVENNGNFEISFEVQEKAETARLLHMTIRNLKDGSEQQFALDGVNDIKPSQFFKFYILSLRANDQNDIAIYSYNSAREGEMFKYFVYNSTTQKFVASPEVVPRLEYSSKTQTYSTALRQTKFKLDESLNLVPLN